MCALAGVSRASFYRFRPDSPRPDRDLELHDAIQRIALEFPSYGWPRMTEELQRRGWTVNHKRVYRLMREDNLLCLRKRKFVVTTDSDHGLPVYPNRARTMVLTGLDQLWVADITYIRLLVELVYLAVILAAAGTRSGTSLRPRRAVRFAGLYESASGAWHPDQHEPSRESLRQRQVRIVPEDAEI